MSYYVAKEPLVVLGRHLGLVDRYYIVGGTIHTVGFISVTKHLTDGTLTINLLKGTINNNDHELSIDILLPSSPNP